MLTNPGLTATGRETPGEHGDQVITALADYVLNGLAHATISTISWTPLRGTAADIGLPT